MKDEQRFFRGSRHAQAGYRSRGRSGTHAEQTGKDHGRIRKGLPAGKARSGDCGGRRQFHHGLHHHGQKVRIKVAHVEAGLRREICRMPEEINRLCTDVLCDYLFTTDRMADENLEDEGVPEEKIFFVGNVMIDTLLKHKQMAEGIGLREQLGLRPRHYATLDPAPALQCG